MVIYLLFISLKYINKYIIIYIMNKLRSNIFIDDLLNEHVLIRKHRYNESKITDEDFIIPNLCEYDNILEFNYNLKQLKIIAKFYKIKGGNKKELQRYCHNYMRMSFYIIKIQTYFRTFIVKRYIYYHGPGFKDKSLCVNDTDFATLDDINIIPYNQFISYKDKDGFIYGFDIQTLYNYFIKNTKKIIIENPYTNKEIDKELFSDILKYVKYSNILNIDITLKLEQIDNLTNDQQLNMKVLSLFQKMDSLGNYTNISWFLTLDKSKLVKFVIELIDIWKYRSELTNNVRQLICSLNGNPFMGINLNNLSHLYKYSYYQIKKIAITCIDNFINKSESDEYSSLGSLYILTALTLVNNDAAESLPWLYESVN